MNLSFFKRDFAVWALCCGCLGLAYAVVPQAPVEQVDTTHSGSGALTKDAGMLAELIGIEVSSAELAVAGATRVGYPEPNSSQRIAVGYQAPHQWWVAPADSTEVALEVRSGSATSGRVPQTRIALDATEIDSISIANRGVRVGSVNVLPDNGSGEAERKSISVHAHDRAVADRLTTQYDSSIVDDLHIRFTQDSILVSLRGSGGANEYTLQYGASAGHVKKIGRVPVTPNDTLIIGGRSRYLAREISGEANALLLQLIRLRKGTNEKEGVLSSLALTDAYHPVPESLHAIPGCAGDSGLTIRRTLAKPTPNGPGLVAVEEPSTLVGTATTRAVFAVPPFSNPTVEADAVLCATAFSVKSPSTTEPLWVESKEGRVRVGAAGIVLDSKSGEALLTASNYLFRIGPGGGQRASAHAWNAALLIIAVSVLVIIPLLVCLTDDRDHVHHLERNETPREVRHFLFSPIRTLQFVSALVGALLIVSVNLQSTLATQPWLIGDTRYASRTVVGAMVICSILIAAAFAMTWIGRPFHERGGLSKAPEPSALSLEVRWRVGALAATVFALTCLVSLAVDRQLIDERLWLSALRSKGGLAFASKKLWLVLISTIVCIGLLLWPGRWMPKRTTVASKSRTFARLQTWWEKTPANDPQAFIRTDHGSAVIALILLVLLAGVMRLLGLFGYSLVVHAGVAVTLTRYVARCWGHTAGAKAPTLNRSSFFSLAGLVVVFSVVIFFLFAGKLPPIVAIVSLMVIPALAIVIWWTSPRDVVASRKVGQIAVAYVLATISMLAIAFLLQDLGGAISSVVALVVGVFTATVTKVDEAQQTHESESEGRYFFLTSFVLGTIVICGLSVLSHLVMRFWAGENEQRFVQRVQLAADASYLSRGEWIVQARWLASQSVDFWRYWVPNEHSDLAIFAINAIQGAGTTVLVMTALFSLVILLFLAAEAGIETAFIASVRSRVAMRWTSLMLVFASSLIAGQWLVHIAPGVSESMPVTGVALPFAGMGGSTHLLFTLAIAVPLVLQARVFRQAKLHPGPDTRQ